MDMHILKTTRGVHFELVVMATPATHIKLACNDLEATAYPADVSLYSDDGGRTNSLSVGSCTVGPIDEIEADKIAAFLEICLHLSGIEWQRNTWNESVA